MPVLGGLDAIPEIRKIAPDCRILLLTMHNDEEIFRTAVSLGADGYILKDDAYESLHWAISMIRENRKAFSPAIASSVLDNLVKQPQGGGENQPGGLTQREIGILQLIAAGCTNRQAGERLCISTRTVESHRARIMEKLAIENFAGLVQFAIRRGLIR
jgi:two-component system response regulator NreC